MLRPGEHHVREARQQQQRADDAEQFRNLQLGNLNPSASIPEPTPTSSVLLRHVSKQQRQNKKATGRTSNRSARQSQSPARSARVMSEAADNAAILYSRAMAILDDYVKSIPVRRGVTPLRHLLTPGLFDVGEDSRSFNSNLDKINWTLGLRQAQRDDDDEAYDEETGEAEVKVLLRELFPMFAGEAEIRKQMLGMRKELEQWRRQALRAGQELEGLKASLERYKKMGGGLAAGAIERAMMDGRKSVCFFDEGGNEGGGGPSGMIDAHRKRLERVLMGMNDDYENRQELERQLTSIKNMRDLDPMGLHGDYQTQVQRPPNLLDWANNESEGLQTNLALIRSIMCEGVCADVEALRSIMKGPIGKYAVCVSAADMPQWWEAGPLVGAEALRLLTKILQEARGTIPCTSMVNIHGSYQIVFPDAEGAARFCIASVRGVYQADWQALINLYTQEGVGAGEDALPLDIFGRRRMRLRISAAPWNIEADGVDPNLIESNAGKLLRFAAPDDILMHPDIFREALNYLSSERQDTIIRTLKNAENIYRIRLRSCAGGEPEFDFGGAGSGPTGEASGQTTVILEETEEPRHFDTDPVAQIPQVFLENETRSVELQLEMLRRVQRMGREIESHPNNPDALLSRQMVLAAQTKVAYHKIVKDWMHKEEALEATRTQLRQVQRELDGFKKNFEGIDPLVSAREQRKGGAADMAVMQFQNSTVKYLVDTIDTFCSKASSCFPDFPPALLPPSSPKALRPPQSPNAPVIPNSPIVQAMTASLPPPPLAARAILSPQQWSNIEATRTMQEQAATGLARMLEFIGNVSNQMTSGSATSPKSGGGGGSGGNGSGAMFRSMPRSARGDGSRGRGGGDGGGGEDDLAEFRNRPLDPNEIDMEEVSRMSSFRSQASASGPRRHRGQHQGGKQASGDGVDAGEGGGGRGGRGGGSWENSGDYDQTDNFDQSARGNGAPNRRPNRDNEPLPPWKDGENEGGGGGFSGSSDEEDSSSDDSGGGGKGKGSKKKKKKRKKGKKVKSAYAQSRMKPKGKAGKDGLKGGGKSDTEKEASGDEAKPKPKPKPKRVWRPPVIKRPIELIDSNISGGSEDDVHIDPEQEKALGAELGFLEGDDWFDFESADSLQMRQMLHQKILELTDLAEKSTETEHPYYRVRLAYLKKLQRRFLMRALYAGAMGGNVAVKDPVAQLGVRLKYVKSLWQKLHERRKPPARTVIHRTTLGDGLSALPPLPPAPAQALRQQRQQQMSAQASKQASPNHTTKNTGTDISVSGGRPSARPSFVAGGLLSPEVPGASATTTTSHGSGMGRSASSSVGISGGISLPPLT